MSIKKLATEIDERLVEEGKILVVVATVTDDSKFHEVPKMTVAALRCTPAAKSRIEKAGGYVKVCWANQCANCYAQRGVDFGSTGASVAYGRKYTASGGRQRSSEGVQILWM